MATVHFTTHLQAFADNSSVEVRGGSLRAALDEALRDNPRLKSYVLDDQNRLRRHVMVFLDGQVVTDRVGLSEHVDPDAEVYVMQALSGG